MVEYDLGRNEAGQPQAWNAVIQKLPDVATKMPDLARSLADVLDTFGGSLPLKELGAKVAWDKAGSPSGWFGEWLRRPDS